MNIPINRSWRNFLNLSTIILMWELYQKQDVLEIADPGADIVRLAHEKNIRVIPLVGPSSVLLSLMASGMNGQNFTFIGYLPAKQAERV